MPASVFPGIRRELTLSGSRLDGTELAGQALRAEVWCLCSPRARIQVLTLPTELGPDRPTWIGDPIALRVRRQIR
jgi:hypothetical protein